MTEKRSLRPVRVRFRNDEALHALLISIYLGCQMPRRGPRAIRWKDRAEQEGENDK